MAISDIPEFVKAQPGDLITAQNWDMVQKLTRESLRLHQHTRPAGTPPTDSDTTDEAGQIGTTEIADGVVTASKLAPASVNTTNLVNGAVTTAQIADGAITTSKLGSAAVTSANLSFQRVGLGSTSLPPGATAEILVQSAIPSSKTTIYFPTLSIVSSTGSGISDITAQMVYQQAVGSTSINLFVRLVNSGAATASIIWVVLTFS